MCYKNNELVDYNLIDSNLLNKYKNNYKDEEIEKDFEATCKNIDDLKNTIKKDFKYEGYVIYLSKNIEIDKVV